MFYPSSWRCESVVEFCKRLFFFRTNRAIYRLILNIIGHDVTNLLAFDESMWLAFGLLEKPQPHPFDSLLDALLVPELLWFFVNSGIFRLVNHLQVSVISDRVVRVATWHVLIVEIGPIIQTSCTSNWVELCLKFIWYMVGVDSDSFDLIHTLIIENLVHATSD